jgi:hypothetical protein
MDIKDLRRDPAPVTPTPPVAPTRAVGRKATEADSEETPRRKDTIEISEKGRSLADEPDEARRAPQATLAPERLVELRRRIQAGDHNSPEMIRSIARGIVSQGDL